MKVKSESEIAQSYPTLHDPIDCSLPGSSVHGILQARVLELVHCLLQQTQEEMEFHLWQENYYEKEVLFVFLESSILGERLKGLLFLVMV